MTPCHSCRVLTPSAIHQVSRPKLSGLPGRHHGVLIQFTDGTEILMDLALGQGLQYKSQAQFACGHDLVIEESVWDPAALSSAIVRLASIEERLWLYDVVFENCEPFARYVVSGRRSSRQVGNAAFAFAAVVGVCWASSAA